MNPVPSPASFEQSLAELEVALRALEDGTTGLEDALAHYERGVGLLKLCYGQLRDAEQRIHLLSGVDDAGRPLLQPFDHAPAVEPAPTAGTVRRKPRIEPPDKLF